MRKHGFLVFSLWAIAAIGSMTFCFAQERQPGGGGITVFADRNFRGKSATFQEDVPDLVRYGMNDRISSLRVAPGEQWEVCEHSNYQGRCAVFSGAEPRLTDSSWGDVISSLRRVGGGAVFPPGSSVPPPQSGWSIVLYDQPSYRGNPTNYKGPVPALSATSRPTQSVTIGRGVWELCEGTNFTGHCVILDKSVPDLYAYGLQNRLSSVRPFEGRGGSVPPPARPTPRPQSDWYIVLYDQPSYRGTPTTYKGAISHLSGSDQRAQSVTIGKGVWELCEGTNFTGRCVVLDKSVPDLNAYGLQNRLSSVRPVSPQPR